MESQATSSNEGAGAELGSYPLPVSIAADEERDFIELFNDLIMRRGALIPVSSCP